VADFGAGFVGLGIYLVAYSIVTWRTETWTRRWPGPIRDFNLKHRRSFAASGTVLILVGLVTMLAT
jgi:hypothetical protein